MLFDSLDIIISCSFGCAKNDANIFDMYGLNDTDY
jgi:hypothetical protein